MKHLKEVDLTYCEHCRHSMLLSFGVMYLVIVGFIGVVQGVVHAILPCVFTDWTTRLEKKNK